MSNKYCVGCGVCLQDENITQDGYTTSLEKDLCSRCFRMKNYGEYQALAKSNEEYIGILKSVDESDDLVLHVVDLLNVEKDIEKISNYISNKKILVLNKKDILPKSVKEEKLIEYFKTSNLDYAEIIVISTLKNYNMDELLKLIRKHKNGDNVYVVGNTNTGKSSLINKMIYNYSNENTELTISPLPSTTLNKVIIKLTNDINLIDTPGLIDRGSIDNYVDEKMLKKMQPKKEIRPITYQMKPNQCLIIGDMVRVEYVEGEKNSFTLYMSNGLKVKRLNALKHEKLKDLYKTTHEIKYYEDLVISGLGWIKIVEKGSIEIYIDKNVETFTRKSLI